MTSGAPDHSDQRPAARRRVPMALITWAFVGLVLLIALVLVVLKVTRGATALPPPVVARAPAAVVRTVTGLPSAVFDAALLPAQDGSAAQVLSGQPSLNAGGRPEVVFVGAEFSPYSAASRWALVAALARFGTFRDLGATSSSTDHVFPGTPTFTFDGASYRSRYVSFVAVEAYGQTPSTSAPPGFPALHPPSSAVQALLRRYDSDTAAPTLPFIDVANRVLFVGSGIGFSPGLLRGSSMGQVAASMADPADPAGRAVVGAADAIAAAICASTGGRPGPVCSSSGVRAAAARLGLP
jgi:hypothetical protein